MVTADLDREVEAKRRKPSKTRELCAIEPFLGFKALLLWFEFRPPSANQVSVDANDSVNSFSRPAGGWWTQVNPNPTDFDASVTYTIRGPSGVILPQLVADTWNTLEIRPPIRPTLPG
jgi:hypothetical protein